MTAGGYDPNAREVWQEAFRIPPLKLVDRGELRDDVWELVLREHPARDRRRGHQVDDRRLHDRQAAAAATSLDRYGAEAFDLHMDYVIEASERLVRAEIARWPDGVYHGESWMVSDGIDPTARYRIAVEITIDGDEITLRLLRHRRPGARLHEHAARLGARGDPDRVPDADQRRRGRRARPTRGCSRRCARCSAQGSLLDPRFPASTIFGNQMCDEVIESIMLALADALPGPGHGGLEPAPLHDARAASTRARRRRRCRCRSSCAAGPGAMRGADGFDALGFSGTPGSMRSPDMEMFELSTPHFMEYCEYLPDSAGRGRVARRPRHDARAGASTGDDELGVDDRRRRPPAEGADPAPGLFGGEPAGLNELRLVLPDGTVREWGSKEIVARHPARHGLRRPQRRRRRLRRPAGGATRGRCSRRCATGCSRSAKARRELRRRRRSTAGAEIDEAETARLAERRRVSYRIGIDVGGTFTDFLLIGPDDLRLVHKTSSTPDDPSRRLRHGPRRDRRRCSSSTLPALRRAHRGDRARHDRHDERGADPARRARPGCSRPKGFRDTLALRERPARGAVRQPAAAAGAARPALPARRRRGADRTTRATRSCRSPRTTCAPRAEPFAARGRRGGRDLVHALAGRAPRTSGARATSAASCCPAPT